MLEFIRVDNIPKTYWKRIWFRVGKDQSEYIEIPTHCSDTALGIEIIAELNRLRDKLQLPSQAD